MDKVIKTPENSYRVFVELLELDKRTEEVFAMVTLDIKNQVTSVFEVSIGNLSSIVVTPREVFERSILQNAQSVILAHNHPSGIPEPSDDDISISPKLLYAGDILDIQVLDHIIIGSKDTYISMKERDII